MNTDPIVALFKLGRQPYMTELLREGHVYMNTVSYFSHLEDGSPRLDPDEGVGSYRQADGATLKMQRAGRWDTVGTLRGAIRFRDDELAAANVYCLHARKPSHYGTELSLDQLGFGDSYVLFLDANEFFRRISAEAARIGREISFGLVEYMDRQTYSGEMGIFRKFSERAGDGEFRIALSPGSGQPLSLRLGDLSDIAIIGSTSEKLRLDPIDPKPPNPALHPTAASSKAV